MPNEPSSQNNSSNKKIPSKEYKERIKKLVNDYNSDGNNKDHGYHQSRAALLLDRLAYGLFGSLFRGKDDAYSDFNRKLNQARIPISYDIYLSRVVFYSITFGAVGAALGLIIALLTSDYLTALESGVVLPSVIAELIVSYERTLVSIVVMAVSGVIGFTSTLSILYYYPFYVAGEREREIDAMLPHIITFMYAMSRGGVNILSVMEAASETEDSYGEVSKEFKAIMNNVEFVKEDLRTAVLEESYETPSDNLRNFLEDLLNVIDTGSNMEQFFLNKSDLYLERARNQQKQLLDTLEIMSESYVTIFVASPIFVLIILVVMSMLGGANITLLYAMTYFGLPVGGIMFSLLIKIMSQTGTEGHAEIARSKKSMPYSQIDINQTELKNDERHSTYKSIQRRKNLTDKLTAPIKIMRRRPPASLILTIPITLLFMYWIVNSGLAELTIDAFLVAPQWQTLVLVYIPLLMTFGTLSVLHEIKTRRETKILKRLPEAFKSAADANSRGLTVEESFKIVASNSDGALAKSLNNAINETTWTGDLNDSLVKFANNLGVPRLSRTIKLITKANEISGDIQAVLNVAAKDVENMHKLDRERRQNAFQYIIIILVSFFVSMGVIVMLDINFLTQIANNPAFAEGGSGAPGIGGPSDGIPIQEFRMAFVHTVMVLGGASGLVGGTMASNDPLKGIKYSLATMGIGLAVFFVF